MNESEMSRLMSEGEASSVEDLLRQYHPYHAELFPEDLLYGSSQLEKYRVWVERVLMPRIRQSGEEGRRIWRVLTSIDYQEHPDVIIAAIEVLGAWFFPSQAKTTAVIGLILIVRKIVRGKSRPEE